MKFDSLKEKCEYYRSLGDYRLLPNSNVICMLDGRSFSSFVKNKFKKPFDDDFITMMNETAKYICKNVSGIKFAYVQSDEINILINDLDNENTDPFFSYRVTKLISIIASMATGKFNQLFDEYLINGMNDVEEIKNAICNRKLLEFDCRVWNVPSYNDAYAWFIYRQNDCIRNSKQQTCQTYLPNKQLLGLRTDAQINILKEAKGINWDDFEDGKKYGRLIVKEIKEFIREETGEKYMRGVWNIISAPQLSTEFINSLI